MRFAITLAAIISCALSPATAEPEPALTWDIIESGPPTYPFEDELKTCIAEDLANRGTGLPCIFIPNDYCPESTIDSGAPRGAMRARACLDYFGRYWSDRMGQAYDDLLLAYREGDVDRAEKDKRAPKLEAYQSVWAKWRNTKCDFVYARQDYYPWINVESSECQYKAFAKRALELEGWLRIAKY